MIEKVRLTHTDIRIGKRLVDLLWLSLLPLPILIVASFLRDLADIDLWIEVCREGLVVITAVAVYDV